MSAKEGKKSNVPKFSSFKPQPAIAPLSPKGKHDESKQSKIVEGRLNDTSRLPSSHTRPSTTSSYRQSDGRHVHDERTTGRSFDVSQRPSHSESNENNNTFVIDKRGDALIRRYGSNNRYDVPSYRRFGAGRLLGADGFFRIDKLGNRAEFYLRGFNERGSTLGKDRKSVLAKTGRTVSEPVRVRAQKLQAYTGTEDFLPLRQSRKRKRSNSISHQSLDEVGPSYRSIHGMSKTHQHSDSDEIYGSDSSSSSITSDQRDLDPVKLRGIELSGRIRDHPQDIDAWIELVDHQNVLLRMNERHGSRATQAEIKSFADIKLSMLEKALSHAQSPTQKDKLRLRVMQEASHVLDPKTMAQRWEDLMKDHGSSFGLWKAYMTFRQTSLSTLRYDDIKQLYINKLHNIESKLAKPGTSSDEQPWYDELAAVLLSVTRFIADAGYAELAVAAWQATLELNFHRPTSLVDASRDVVRTNFQRFWESEVSRLGDESAKGWATFGDGGDTENFLEPKTFDSGSLPSTRDVYKAWAAIEQQRAASAKVPARTMDDGIEDDPYRVIMYADIEDLLVFIPIQSLSMVQDQLLDAFLTFHHLPPVFGTGQTTEDILKDERLNGGSNVPLLRIENDLYRAGSMQELGVRLKPPEFVQDYQNMTRSLEVLFPSQHWFTYMEPTREAAATHQRQLISNTLKQLARSIGRAEVATYYLSFESLDDRNNSKRTAKRLMKQDPKNMELYSGFAKTEFAMGNKAAAKKVLSAALGLPAISSQDRLSLCITSAWMELEDGELEKALMQLCLSSGNIPSGESATSTQVLKTRQLLTSNRDYLLSSGDPNNATIYAKGLALLEYLTKASGREPQSKAQGDIWSAMASVASCSEDLSSRGFAKTQAHERLLQFSGQLLYNHARHGPYRPAFLREQMAKYIDCFPQNTIFLTLYAWREERLSVDDRVRSLLDSIVLMKPYACVSSWVFAIRHEMTTGNVHSTRAAFERALETDVCRHHIGIWISYIRYCHHEKELRAKAKDAFYRAIQNCPWSKDIFMEAFVTLAKDMDSVELKSVYNTLCEKGLRVHVELEEFLDNWREAQKRDASSRGGQQRP